MSKYTITRKSSTFEKEVNTKALALHQEGKIHGILFGCTSVFIGYEPKNAITVYLGIEALDGIEIYVGKD